MAILTLNREIELYEKEVERRTFDEDKNRIILRALRAQLRMLELRKKQLGMD